MASLTQIKQRFWNNDGTVAAGGKVYTYLAGTITLTNSYTDSTGSTPNANPIILDGKGEASIWTNGLVKINVLQSDMVQITGYPVDYVGGTFTLLSDLAASSGSSLVGFIQSGTGALARTVQSKNREIVSVLDFGAVGNGVTNDAVAIKAAYEYVAIKGGDLFLPTGNYYIGTTTLVFDKPYVRVKGEGIPNRDPGTSPGSAQAKCTTITYSGTGTAIQFGKEFPAGTGAPFVFGICLENIQLIVANNTNIGIAVLGAAYGHMSFVTVAGNSGSVNYGIRSRGTISFKFYMLDIVGYGETGTILANYLGNGFYSDQAYTSDTLAASSETTATSWERCYFHYCNQAFFAQATSTSIMTACDYEASTYGLVLAAQVDIQIIDPHFEANTYCIYLAPPAAANANKIRITGAMFNHYAQTIFFQAAGFGAGVGPLLLKFRDCNFSSSAATAYLFNATSGFTSKSRIEFENCNFHQMTNLSTTNAGSSIGESAWFKFSDMPIIKYTFYFTFTAVSQVNQPMIYAGGAMAKAILPSSGHIIGTNTYYSVAVTAGDYAIDAYYNGSILTGFSSGYTTSNPILSSPFAKRVVSGDILTAKATSGATLAPATGTVIMEILVAQGKDGFEAY